MGTRALTRVMEDGKELLCIYRQFDGYPEGLGLDIKKALGDRVIVNGMTGDKEAVCNGMGCLAATLVAKLKSEAGNVYVYPVGSRDCGEEFVYTLHQGPVQSVKTDQGWEKEQWPIMLKVEEAGGQTLYDGPIAAFEAAKEVVKPKKVRAV